MNIDKIRGGLGFIVIKIDGAESVQVKSPMKYVEINVKKNPWIDYRKKVRAMTELVCKNIPGIEKRGFKDYHIDHIVSIWNGFKKGIPPNQIADINNLRMIPYKENLLKGRR